jgi:hypothetical protein
MRGRAPCDGTGSVSGASLTLDDIARRVASLPGHNCMPQPAPAPAPGGAPGPSGAPTAAAGYPWCRCGRRRTCTGAARCLPTPSTTSSTRTATSGSASPTRRSMRRARATCLQRRCSARWRRATSAAWATSGGCCRTPTAGRRRQRPT